MTFPAPKTQGIDGQFYYGDRESGKPTHVWEDSNREWRALSDDSVMEKIPGLDAIPADMPNAPEGDVPLAYDLQTFNALVAANTAQQTEMSALNDKIQMLVAAGDRDRETIAKHESAVAEYAELRKEDRETLKAFQESHSAACKRADDFAKIAKEADATAAYERERATALNLQLERMKGYLDRTLEQDEQYDKTPAIPEQPILRPRGPRIGEISMPLREEQNAMWSDAHETVMRATAGARRPSRTF